MPFRRGADTGCKDDRKDHMSSVTQVWYMKYSVPYKAAHAVVPAVIASVGG
jgi:hypothetical protein